MKSARKWAASSRANIAVKADLVIPVPDSGVCAAMGYSEESGIPFEMAFIRNHYVGRSFLQPTQLIRDFDVRVKLNLIASLVKDKRVVIVDDSIVRGTTCKTRVKTLKEAGAREVHVWSVARRTRIRAFMALIFPTAANSWRRTTAGRNPQIPERRFVALSFAGGHGQGHRQTGGIILHGLLRRKISRALRSRARQAHHRTPPQPGPDPRRSRGEGQRANQIACRFSRDASLAQGARQSHRPFLLS